MSNLVVVLLAMGISESAGIKFEGNDIYVVCLAAFMAGLIDSARLGAWWVNG